MTELRIMQVSFIVGMIAYTIICVLYSHIETTRKNKRLATKQRIKEIKENNICTEIL